MKKFLVFIIIIMICLVLPIQASDFDGQAALNDIYSAAPNEVTDYLSNEELNEKTISEVFTFESIINLLSSHFITTLSDNIGIIVSVIGLLILMGIYDSLRDSFSAKGTEKIADFFCAAAVALLICPPVMERASELSQVVCELSDYMELSLPVLCGILTASGNVSSAGVFHFFVYQAIAFAGNLFSGILLPLTGSYISIGIAASITNNDGLKNLTSTIRTVTTKCMIFLCTVFTALLSLQGVVAGAGDTVSKRALKLAVGSFLPVTGNLMAESVDTFMGGVGVIRSVAGVFGVVVIFYLIIIPILKTLANFLLIKASAFAGEMMGMPRIRALLSFVSDGFGMLLAIAAGVGVMFIICMAFLLITGGAT